MISKYVIVNFVTKTCNIITITFLSTPCSCFVKYCALAKHYASMPYLTCTRINLYIRRHKPPFTSYR